MTKRRPSNRVPNSRGSAGLADDLELIADEALEGAVGSARSDQLPRAADDDEKHAATRKASGTRRRLSDEEAPERKTAN